MTRHLQSPKRAHAMPMNVEKAEDCRLQRIERPELRRRRASSLAQSLETSTRRVQCLAQTVAESNERHVCALTALSERYNAQVIERERSLLETLHGLLAIVQQHMHHASESGAQQIQQIEHLVDRAQAEQDWAGVVREVITQGSAIAQRLIRPREHVTQDVTLRDTTAVEIEAPKHEPPPSVAIPPSVTLSADPLPRLDPAVPLQGAAVLLDAQSDSCNDSDFLAKFFGFSANAAIAAEDCRAESPAEQAADEIHGLACTEPTNAAAVEPGAPCPASRLADPSPAVFQRSTEHIAALPDAGEAMDPAAIVHMLSRLMAQHAPKKERARPKEWSRAWALHELKRRILDLGEMGFLTTVTQPRRLLPFLRELGEAIRPPDVRPLPAPA